MILKVATQEPIEPSAGCWAAAVESPIDGQVSMGFEGLFNGLERPINTWPRRVDGIDEARWDLDGSCARADVANRRTPSPRRGPHDPSRCRVAGSRQPVAAGRGVSVSSFPRCGQADLKGASSTLSALG